MEKVNIFTLQGYYTRFFQLLKVAKTHKQAWEMIEKEYFEKTGVNKYKSFESFQVAKLRYFQRHGRI